MRLTPSAIHHHPLGQAVPLSPALSVNWTSGNEALPPSDMGNMICQLCGEITSIRHLNREGLTPVAKEDMTCLNLLILILPEHAPRRSFLQTHSFSFDTLVSSSHSFQGPFFRTSPSLYLSSNAFPGSNGLAWRSAPPADSDRACRQKTRLGRW